MMLRNSFFVFSLFFLAQVVNGQDVYSVDQVPNVHLQRAEEYVSDPEHKLAEEYIERLNHKLHYFDDSLDVQCATIVLPAIDDEPAAFAHDLFNKWGLGDGATDRGLLILLVYGYGEGSQRDIYIATGYGLEAELPDALCKRIEMQTMVPLLKQEKFGEGLVAGLDEIHTLLVDDAYFLALTQEIEDEEAFDTLVGVLVYSGIGAISLLIWWGLLSMVLKKDEEPYEKWVRYKASLPLGCIFALVFLPFLPFFFIIRKAVLRRFMKKNIKCEACGSWKLKMIGKAEVLREATSSQKGCKRYTMVCRDCKHKAVVEALYSYVPSGRGGSSIIGGSYGGNNNYGGSSSSGSSSGGSWGGGSSGGGGAGSSF